MDDETSAVQEESSAQTIPGMVERSTYNAAISNTSSRDIIMSNCTTNVAFTTAAAEPSDLRRIPLGDIDLQHEIRLDNDSGVVSLRRVHSAKIDRGRSIVTVAIYQGDGAKREWREAITKYMSVRHPNIIQICGTARSGDIHATIFHDDLIPLQQFLNLYRHSHFSTVYIYVHCIMEFEATRRYLQSTFQRRLGHEDCTFWMRRSTGRLCADLAYTGNMYFTDVYDFSDAHATSFQQGIQSLGGPGQDAQIIEFLTLNQYHDICHGDLRQSRCISILSPVTVNLGAVISCSPGDQLDDLGEIACLPVYAERSAYAYRWSTLDTSRVNVGEVMDDSWTRCASGDLPFSKMGLWASAPCTGFWLSQANHIFSHLQILSNHQNYALVEEIVFEIVIASAITAEPPEGFLFLCPPEDFHIGLASFRWPDCPAYWALDPLGTERLSMEDATGLGFPLILLSTRIEGSSWDAGVYAGLRQFHEANGFDPESLDVAMHLGHELYEFSGEINGPYAHVDDAEDDCGPINADYNSEHTQQTSSWVPLNPSPTFVDQHSEHIIGLQEELPVSQTFKFFVNAQLTLILVLTSFWLYDQVSGM
ncbi:hypothetical protein MVEN_02137700 [Mycena venus]|uniref:Protein kinase domain-containing protein n=1 Tax=Mycena venus TaxID=2733690 RepID=A0A8H6XAD4_9AGAR|nr:hypothetical protein MVEN_02137700 [Mycena venus]